MPTDSTPEPPPPAGGEAAERRILGHTRTEFWTAVSAIAAVVAAGVSLVAVLFGAVQCGSTTSSEISAAPGPSSVPQSTTSSAAATTTAPVADPVRYSGPVNLTYLDLDADPPRVLSSNTGASMWVDYDSASSAEDFPPAEVYGLGGGFLTTKPTVAQWNNPGRPTREQCSELISTQSVETLPITEESRFCVKTAANRFAFVSGLAADRVAGTYRAQIIVWGAEE